jgi:hypothetical protein
VKGLIIAEPWIGMIIAGKKTCMLVDQSATEGILLPTADPIVARYPGPVRKVTPAVMLRR